MANRTELLNDIEEVIRTAMDGRQVSMWTALPGIVKSVDFSKMTCTVQPAIMGAIVDQNNVATSVNLPLLVDVPIVFPSAGGFTITFPLKSGDEVLVVFSSRCIDAWWQSGGVQQAMEARMHDLSDGFAIPGPRSVPKVPSGVSTTGCQIRNDAGTTYVEISGNGKIKLVSPSEIDITAPLVAVTGNLTVSGTIVAVGAVTGALLTGTGLAIIGGGSAAIAGSVAVVGAVSAASVAAVTVAASSDVTAGAISLASHTHPVTTAPGTTGAPT